MFQLRDNCTTSSRRTRASRYNWSCSKRTLGFNKKIWHTPGSYFFFTPLSFFSFFLLFLPRNYFYTRGRQWVKILCVKRGGAKRWRRSASRILIFQAKFALAVTGDCCFGILSRGKSDLLRCTAALVGNSKVSTREKGSGYCRASAIRRVWETVPGLFRRCGSFE